ncbi:recombination-associated protein RdgC [Marinobacterium lutimaris]|uniref:Recombination-associated protein RdgC n=1 Tax=Marinobacterium lutimaris TaxID=568106 RepID=A0A1H5YCL2_9GAMM|nr:recombination-associated protein RdgC [Marinobacterium lutimaris]SEG21475.1 recombination associated protein RdgC [Marinobacterium lutimaris]
MLFFKNATWYRFTPDTDFSADKLEQALSAKPFTPCSRHEQKRTGWTSPTHGLTESPVFASTGYLLICLQVEERILPGSVVRDALNEKVEQIEHDEERKVFRKERAQLKEEVTFELLPRAFTRRKPTWALISAEHGFIVVDANRMAKAEALLSELREALGSLRVRLPEVQRSPGATLSSWIIDGSDIPTPFQLEQECELHDTLAEDAGVIKVKGQDLTSNEIRAHIEGGMEVTKLALCWEQQLRFILKDDLTLARLKLTDKYRDQQEEQSPEEELAALDADVTQLGLEFTRLIPQLLEAFGGEMER